MMCASRPVMVACSLCTGSCAAIVLSSALTSASLAVDQPLTSAILVTVMAVFLQLALISSSACMCHKTFASTSHATHSLSAPHMGSPTCMSGTADAIQQQFSLSPNMNQCHHHHLEQTTPKGAAAQPQYDEWDPTGRHASKENHLLFVCSCLHACTFVARAFNSAC